jgi:hypothetical protein
MMFKKINWCLSWKQNKIQLSTLWRWHYELLNFKFATVSWRVNGDKILFAYIIDYIYVLCLLHWFKSSLYYHEKRREYFKRDINFQNIYVSSTNKKETVKRYCIYYELLSKSVNRFLIYEVVIYFHIKYSSQDFIEHYYKILWGNMVGRKKSDKIYT